MIDPVRDTAKLFVLLGNVHRVRICRMLAEEGELSVTELTHSMGMLQPNVSQQLKLLRIAGILDRRRDGKKAYYFLSTRTRGSLLARMLYPFGLEDSASPKPLQPRRERATQG
jgi:DNA-binding transcriptional ArsR family regulator